MIPFPRRQVGQFEPFNFLHSVSKHTWSMHWSTYADLLPRLRFEHVVFGYTGNDEHGDSLLFDSHFDEVCRIYFSGQVVSSFFEDLGTD